MPFLKCISGAWGEGDEKAFPSCGGEAQEKDASQTCILVQDVARGVLQVPLDSRLHAVLPQISRAAQDLEVMPI